MYNSVLKAAANAAKVAAATVAVVMTPPAVTTAAVAVAFMSTQAQEKFTNPEGGSLGYQTPGMPGLK